MAEQIELESGEKSPNDLEVYQLSLKKNLNMLGSCFSIVLILVGLFLLVNGLFGIVNQNKENASLNSTDNYISGEGSISDEIPVKNDESEQGQIGEGLSTQRVKAESSSATIKAAQTEEQISTTHKWKATDYEKGEIGVGSYTVKLGDTLWEIAEAVYGSGAQWTKILDANSSSIGFLPNGSHALIVPGQVLMINR